MPWLGPAVAIGRRQRSAGAGASAPVAAPSAGFAGGYAAAGSIALPALDTSVRGSGFTKTAIGWHSCWPYRRISNAAGETIFIRGVSADPAINPLAEVRVYLENATPVVITTPTKIGGLWGYLVTLKSGANDGLADLTVEWVPVNGKILRVTTKVILATNGTLNAARPVRYLSPTGLDTNSGLNAGAAWKTFAKGMASAPEDALVICAPGDYDETVLGLAIVTSLRAPIEFNKALPTDLVKITRSLARTTDSGQMRIRANLVKFVGIDLDTSKFPKINPLADNTVPVNTPVFTIVEGGVWTDSLSSADRIGPDGGYHAFSNNFFGNNEGQMWATIGLTCEAVGTTGVNFAMDCNFTTGTDTGGLSLMSQTGRNNWLINHNQTFKKLARQRYTLENPATIQSFQLLTSPTRTEITLDAPATLTATATNGADVYIAFDTGALAGTSVPLYQTIAASRILVATGDITASIAIGNQLYSYAVVHADTYQVGEPGEGDRGAVPVAGNAAVDGGKWSSTVEDFQPIFLTPKSLAGIFSITTVGTALTVNSNVATASANPTYDAPNNRTTFVWNAGITLQTIGAAVKNRTPIRFLTGALAGQDFRIYSQSGLTTTVLGDATAALAGNTAAPWAFAVGDFIQATAAGGNFRVWRQIIAAANPNSATLDAAFPLDLTASTAWIKTFTVRDLAIVNLFTTQRVTSGTLSQTSGGLDNVVIAGTTSDRGFQMRTNLSAAYGFGAVDTLIVNNISESYSADAGTPVPTSRGVTIDNNAVITLPSFGTNYTTISGVTYDASGRPTGSLPAIKVNAGNSKPLIPYDRLGTALGASSKVGAVQP
jgi:hypothetical protein